MIKILNSYFLNVLPYMKTILRTLHVPEKIIILLIWILFIFASYTYLFSILFFFLLLFWGASSLSGWSPFLTLLEVYIEWYFIFIPFPIVFTSVLIVVYFFYLLFIKTDKKNIPTWITIKNESPWVPIIKKTNIANVMNSYNTVWWTYFLKLRILYTVWKNYIILSSIIYIVAMICFYYNFLVWMFICTFFMYILTLKRATLFWGTFQYFSYVSFFFLSIPFWGAIIIFLYASPLWETAQKK